MQCLGGAMHMREMHYIMITKHDSFTITEAGLFVDSTHPLLDANLRTVEVKKVLFVTKMII